MEKILSQEEVDALLRGLTDGDIETEQTAAQQPTDIRTFDLTSQDRMTRGRLPTLEIINDRLARLLQNSMSGAARKVIEVTLSQTAVSKFGDLLRTLPIPTSLHIVRMEPLRGLALLAIESRLIFSLVDCLLGGSGKSSVKIEGRDFTAIEQRVIRRIVQVILKDLEQAWQPVVALHFQCTRSEMNPQFASIVAPSELATVITFDLALDQLIGQINLCLPYSTLEPIRAKLLAPFQSDQLEIDARWIKRMEQQLRELEVDVLVELGWGTIHGRDLLNLSIGDTILLHQDIADPLLVKVEGVPKFRATAGTFKGTHVVKVIEEIQAPGG